MSLIRLDSRSVLSLLILLFMGVVGCQTTTVSIKVKVPSEIDVDRYNKLAIVPFINRGHTAKEHWGELLASILRRSLNRPHKFEILDTKDTNLILAGEAIEADILDQPGMLADLGGELGVDALVMGTYRFSSVSEPRRIYYDRYSATLQRYVTDSVIYYQKNYKLRVEVFIVDAETGEIVWKQPYESAAWETHNVATFLISEAVQSDSIFRNLASQVASAFTRQIAPHYETVERVLVKQ